MKKMNVLVHEPAVSAEKREQILARMREVSGRFYDGATRTGAHAFIEFCGLMNEFISICEAAESLGIDWMNANTHNGTSLPMQTHHAAYLGEKINCIYGPALLNDENVRNALVSRLFGGKFKLVPNVAPGATRNSLSTTKLTRPQERMLRCAVAMSPTLYGIASTSDRVNAGILHRLKLGAFDNGNGHLAPTNAGFAWCANNPSIVTKEQ